LNEAAGAALNLLLEWECQQFSCRQQAALPMNGPVAVGSTMTATNNISTHPTGDAGATFCNPLAFVEGHYRASRARVVMSGFSATPNPLTTHTANNLLSPISNIRAISRKLCMRLRLAIVDDHRP
jgi:hypothetical protein